MALGLMGAFGCAVAVSIDQFGSVAQTGTKELTVIAIGFVLIFAAILLRFGLRSTKGWHYLALFLQAALLTATIRLYEIESETFFRFLFGLIACGFVANCFLPRSWRPGYFLALSLYGMIAVLGPLNGLIMLFLGLILIAICHSPIPLWTRILIILTIALVLASVRVGWIEAPWLSVVLPIFASIFMFRLVIYLYDLSNGSGPTDWPSRISYFFMLPNFVFPFFPVVDFTAWGRSQYAKPELEIYQRGMVWVLLGTIHLMLYRWVNYYLALDPIAVNGFWQFIYYAFANFGLYLKISGLFHMILGCLYLFGFALPETHTRYYLSFSFIEFWRRINIYWKDFMQKMVFNPVYTELKKRRVKHLNAIVVSILAVFFLTWALHAYQWFWLRGSILMTVPDIMFWSALAVFLVIQTIQEAQPARPEAKAHIGPGLLLALRTIATMLVIVILWAMWSSETMTEWFALLSVSGLPLLLSNAEWTGTAIFQSAAFVCFLFTITAFALGFTFGLAPPGSLPRKSKLAGRKTSYHFGFHGWTVGLVSAGMIMAQMPFVYTLFAREVQVFVVDMSTQRLSSRDQAKLERGYYEHLTNVKMINSELWSIQNAKRPIWPLLEETTAVEFTDDYLAFRLRPTIAISHKGSTLSTNRLGMRDKEYSVEKPEGVKRILVIGASRAMGEGVADNEVFESLIENDLNKLDGTIIESLNLSVAGYDAFQKQMVLEQRAYSLLPDVVLHISHNNDFDLGRRLARYVGSGKIPFSYLDAAISKSGAKGDMVRSEIERRIKPFASDVIRESYRNFVEETRAMGAVPVWVFIPSTEHYLEPLPDGLILRRLAEEAGFVVIDLFDIFNGFDVQKIRIAPWDHHPNAIGHRMIAERLESELLASAEIRAALDISE
jgi:hypothetical protein